MKLCRLWIGGLLLLPGLLFAHGDEDHGAAASAPTATAVQTLRVEAASELFELVGTLQGGQLVIHLDRFDNNAPVLGAKLSVAGGPLKATAAVERDGVYTLAAGALAAPGTHPLVFTVVAGQTSDLLTGELVVAGAAPAAAHVERINLRWIAAVVAAALLLGGGAIAWRRRRAHPAGAFQ